MESAIIAGLTAHKVKIETKTAIGGSGIVVVGPEQWAKETRMRVKAALRNSGVLAPDVQVRINGRTPGPTDTGLDLPIALAVLGIRDVFAIGELSLSGQVRAVRGVLPMLDHARDDGRTFAPYQPDARGTGATLVATLSGALEIARSGDWAPDTIAPMPAPDRWSPRLADTPELAGVVSEIIAAWDRGERPILVGPPGVGKTIAARIAVNMLPDLTPDQSAEVSRIYSVAGLLPGGGRITRPPFRAPHHTVSDAGLIGGGPGAAVRPGEFTLAHRGVLFLDELPEFSRSARERIRLADGTVSVHRTLETTTMPADCRIVATANPCPCGWFGVDGAARKCTCPIDAVERYRARVLGDWTRIPIGVVKHGR